jgi:hypothetical protein
MVEHMVFLMQCINLAHNKFEFLKNVYWIIFFWNDILILNILNKQRIFETSLICMKLLCLQALNLIFLNYISNYGVLM